MTYTPPALEDGTEVASVTTIIGDNLAWGMDSLMEWQLTMVKIGRDPEQIRDKAGAFGTHVHAMIEHDDPDLPVEEEIKHLLSVGDLEEANQCYRLFKGWEERHEMVSRENELRLANAEHMFGGTIDRVAEVDGEDRLVDFKTSRTIKPRHFVQLAGYQWLYELERGETYPGTVLHIRPDRKPVAYPVDDLTVYREVFETCLRLHRIHEEVKDGMEPG